MQANQVKSRLKTLNGQRRHQEYSLELNEQISVINSCEAGMI